MLHVCPKCQQHSLSNTDCPHCDTHSPNITHPAVHLMWGAMLTGCLKTAPESNSSDGPTPKMEQVEAEIKALYGAPPIDFREMVVDMDQDGFKNDVDCDDNDPNTYPGAAEKESDTECKTDADQDGFGAPNSEVGISGFDCDDNDPKSFPGSEDCPKMFIPDEEPMPLYGVAPDIVE